MRKIIGRKDTCEKFLKHLYYGTPNFKDEIIQVSSPYKANMFSKIEMHKCGGCDVGLPLRDFVRSSRNHFAQCFYKKLSLVLPFFTQVHVLCDLTSHFGQKRKKKKTYTQRVIHEALILPERMDYQQKNRMNKN